MTRVVKLVAVPVLTLLIGGVVVTESVYAIPGLGRLTVDAVLARDFGSPAETVGMVPMVSSARTSNCALLAGGRVKCWGDNSVGQLGTGSSTDVLTAVKLVDSGVAQVSAGFDFTEKLLAGQRSFLEQLFAVATPPAPAPKARK